MYELGLFLQVFPIKNNLVAVCFNPSFILNIYIYMCVCVCVCVCAALLRV
jgi:hypothetical protein